MENETDEVVSGVSTLAMAVDRSGPLSFADICDLGAEVAGRLAELHDAGDAHGHVAAGSVVRLDDGPWRLAPSSLVADIEPVTAPELGEGAEPTAAADVYALGAVLSYGLTGEPIGAPAGTETEATEPEAEQADPTTGRAESEHEPDGTETGQVEDETIELTAEDLDRLATIGGPRDRSEEPDGPEPHDPRAAAAPDDVEAIDLTADGPAGPMTLPEVMSSFLVTLRACLAADPADRPRASDLAATMRQLRSDAEVALGGGTGATTVTIGDGVEWVDGEEVFDDGFAAGYAAALEALPPPPPPPAPAPDGALAVEGTGATASLAAAGAKPAGKRGLKGRMPAIVAVGAVCVALLLGVSLVRERNDKSADLLATAPTQGTMVRRSTTTRPPALPVDLIVETTTTVAPSTTSTTATTVVVTTPETAAPTTTPETTVPSTTTPPTTAAVTTTTQATPSFVEVKVTCGTQPGNPCRLFAEPDATSAPQGPALTNGFTLQAQCITTGVPPYTGAPDTWVRIIGPAPITGSWLSVTHLGNTVPPALQRLACPANLSS